MQIVLSKNNIQTLHWVHRLIASAFIANPSTLKEVNHKDGNRANNAVENLEWVTRAENNQHAYRAGLRVAAPSHGEANGSAKLTAEEVRKMRSLRPHFPLRELAKRFGVGISTVCSICRRESWKHIA